MKELEILRSRQNAAWRILDHDLRLSRADAAYLFAGPRGTRKKEAAVLFAQSLVCPHAEGGWACGKCSVCRRVRDGGYADIRILDGAKASIKKEEIEQLQDYFSRTALEQGGRKAYILNAADNMTASSMNSILKFLEEPSGRITAILCTENPERILPTIRSRCKLIPFRAPSRDELEEEAREEGVDALDAHVLAANAESLEELKRTAGTEGYQSGLAEWMEFVSHCAGEVEEGVFYLRNEAFDGKRKERQKGALPWFLRAGVVYCEDLLTGKRGISGRWDRALAQWEEVPVPPEALEMVLLKAEDALLAHCSVSLTADRLGYALSKEALNGRK